MTNQQDRKALIKIVHPIKPTSDIQNNDLTINHRISYLINLSATALCMSREFYKSLPSHTNDRKRRRQKAVEIIANLCFGERNCLNCKSRVCELFTNNVVFFVVDSCYATWCGLHLQLLMCTSNLYVSLLFLNVNIEIIIGGNSRTGCSISDMNKI